MRHDILVPYHDIRQRLEASLKVNCHPSVKHAPNHCLLHLFRRSLLFLLLTCLVSHRARSLACGLAGCLALAASALLHRVVQRLRVQCLDMFHLNLLLMIVKYYVKHMVGWGIPAKCSYYSTLTYIFKVFF